MTLVLATLGFTAIIGQVTLMRELVAVFYGNELVFGLILAWWLLWEAVGAWALGRWASRRQWGARALAAIMIIAALALPLEMVLTRSARELMGTTTGALIPLERMLLAIGLIVAPYCLVHGLGFSLGARLMGGDSAGKAYAYESLGAVVGGTLFSFVLVNRIDPFQTLLLVGAATLVVVIRVSSSRPSRPLTSALIGVTTFVLAMVLGARLNQTTLARQWPRLVYAADSRYGRLTVTALGDQRAFFENGLLAFETESTFPEEVVHLPMLAHPVPRRVLLIGGGVAGNLAEILKHKIDEVTYLELDPMVIEAARVHLPPEQAAVLQNPRVNLVLRDGRHFTKRTSRRFDVVIVDVPEPSTGQLNRFYTLEFFQEVKELLTEDGVLSIGMPSAENYWTPELARRNASVYRTMRRVFPTVLVTPGDHTFFLATTATSFPFPDVLSARLVQRNITTRWIAPEYIDFLFRGDRFYSTQTELQQANDVRLNRDLAPICYFYDLALWISRFGSGLRGFFETTSLTRLAWVVPPLLIALAVLWGRKRAISFALIGGTGFAGMTLQIVILLSFQVLHGYVYYQLGLLVTAFMGGLALGAGVLSREHSAVSGRRLAAIQTGLVVLALGLAAVLPLGVPAPGFTFPLFATIAGALTGAVFPAAAVLSAPPNNLPAEGSTAETNVIAGLLYGADLMGGCIGAIATSMILVPVLGVMQTCLVVALVAGAGALLSLYPSFSNPC